MDSVGRKVQAVQAMAEALGIADRVQLRCERAEKTGRDPTAAASSTWPWPALLPQHRWWRNTWCRC